MLNMGSLYNSTERNGSPRDRTLRDNGIIIASIFEVPYGGTVGIYLLILDRHTLSASSLMSQKDWKTIRI